MNAAEAYRLASEAKSKKETGLSDGNARLLQYVKTRISGRVREGEFDLDNPFTGVRMAVTAESKSVVFAALRAEGYKVTPLGKISWHPTPKAPPKPKAVKKV